MEDSFSTAPSRRSLLLAGLIATAMTAAVLMILPDIDVPTALGGNLRPVQITALTVTNSIIAYLVLLQFYADHKLSNGLLSVAFGYSALMSGYLLINLPGVFSARGGYPLGSHMATWLWLARLGGTAFLILLATLVLQRQQDRPLSKRVRCQALSLCVLAPLGLAWFAVTVLSRLVPDLNSLVKDNGDYSALTHSGIGAFLLASWFVALLSVLLVTRLRSAFHCWLALSCYSYLLYLITVCSSSIRYTVGWHASRFFELAAAGIMLGALLFEVLKLQTRLQHSYRQAYEASIHDSLTGLSSRRHFDAVLKMALQQQARHQAPLTLLMADIDFFKQYNDHFGHVEGDRCIQRIAACMAEQLRGGDTVARYGGEEFVAILQYCDLVQARQAAERFRAAVESLALPTPPGSLRPVVTVSVGLYCHPANSPATAGWLVEQADRSLYAAKHAGRNRIGSSETSPSAA
nr:GGDEF domain-containing protein [uncultured Pseudogulbenkiania sp.]